MKYLIITIVSLTLMACQVLVQSAKPIQIEQNNTTNNLIDGPSEIGDEVKLFKVPVIINKPRNAVLKIDFRVSSTGHCSTSYEPTVIYLNGEPLVSFDFREKFLHSRVQRTININKDRFIAGENLFEISSGACDYDIDIFDLNGLVLEHDA